MPESRDFLSNVAAWPRATAGRLVPLVLVLALVAALLGVQPATPAAGQVVPSVTVDPESGPPGAGLVVAGDGFSGCAVELSFQQPDDDDVDLGRVFLDSAGSFRTEVAVPEEAMVGPATIVADERTWTGDVCVGQTGVSAQADFDVTEPGLEPRFVPVKPETTEVLEGFADDRIHVKFRQDTSVRVRDGRFVSLDAGDNLSPLKALLDGTYSEVVVPSRLFDARSEKDLDAEKQEVEELSGREQGDKNLYFRLSFEEKSLEWVGQLIDDLNALDLVELAYPESAEELDPISHTDDYRPFQGYRVGAPGGINADAARTVDGGRGENVQIIDIERWFNPDHEDLPEVTVYPNGNPLTAFNAPFDHGTAVLGQIFGLDNDDFGVLGLADEAKPAFVSRAGGTSNAIDIATVNSEAGDVILLEVQLAGANGGCTSNTQVGCVAVEFVQANYDAIVTATSLGINVVQAAGNGSEDLDAAVYNTTFGTRPDSGSIIVGAGAADPAAGVATGTGTPGDCIPTAPPRGRLGFSTFGDRVDLQGWGECVTTTGYGNLQGSPDSDDAYSGTFGGTSSASPIVTAAVGIVSSVAQEQGTPLTPVEVRDLLAATGTPQDTDTPGALAGNIGPLPNLAAALGLGADLSVTKVADRDPVAAGTELTYTVTVANDGPSTAADVELEDELPAEVTFVSADGCTGPVAGVLTCDLGDLAAGASTVVEIVVAIPADLVYLAGRPVTITNEATVSSTTFDPDLLNNTFALDTDVVAVADLKVDSVDVAGVPIQALVGEDVEVTVTSLVRNLGPSSPMDAVLTTTATATPSLVTIKDPASVVATVTALTVGTPQRIEEEFTIRCVAPGQQEVVFDVAIAPANDADTDPNPANDTGQVTATLECVTPIAINIRPGNDFNWINVGSQLVVGVAALTTEVGEYGLPLAFDATTIVPDTARFGTSAEIWTGTGGAPLHNGIFHLRDSFELDDRTKDGDLDMVLSHRTSATGIMDGDVEACLRGQYEVGGQVFTFFGCDGVITLP